MRETRSERSVGDCPINIIDGLLEVLWDEPLECQEVDEPDLLSLQSRPALGAADGPKKSGRPDLLDNRLGGLELRYQSIYAQPTCA